MTQQNTAIADAIEVLSQPPAVEASEPIHELGVAEMDEYGRTEAERTIVLDSFDADAINTEVTDGKHKTYDDALHYVIARGFAEIKRQREAARQLAEKTLLKAKRDQWSKVLQSNPELIKNADLVGMLLKELGVVSGK